MLTLKSLFLVYPLNLLIIVKVVKMLVTCHLWLSTNRMSITLIIHQWMNHSWLGSSHVPILTLSSYTSNTAKPNSFRIFKFCICLPVILGLSTDYTGLLLRVRSWSLVASSILCKNRHRSPYLQYANLLKLRQGLVL